MGKTSLQAAFDAGFASVKGYVNRSLSQFEERLIALEAKQTGLRYLGVWCEGEYEPGNFVTFNGGLWCCERRTVSRPGQDSCWRLAVKSGQFSK